MALFLLAALSAASICSLSNALHAGQAWADARLERHIGPVHIAYQRGDEITLSTDANVVASHKLKTGNMTWRHVSSEGERNSGCAVLSVGTYTLSALEIGSSIVQSRNEIGAVRWQKHISTSVAEWAAGPTIAAAEQRIGVAAGGIVSIFDAIQGTAIGSMSAGSRASFVSTAWSSSGSLYALSLRGTEWSTTAATGKASAGEVTAWKDGKQGATATISFSEAILPHSASLVAGKGEAAVAVAASADGSGLQAACVASTTASSTAVKSFALGPLVEQAGSSAPAGATIQRFHMLPDVSGNPLESEFSVGVAALSTGGVLYVKVQAQGQADCSAAVKGLQYTAAGSAGSAATLAGRTYAVIVGDNVAPGSQVAVVDGTSRVIDSLRLQPLQAAEKAHGGLWRAFAFPFVRSDGASSLGWRVLSVHADGYTHMSKAAASADVNGGSGITLWAADEGAACAVQGLLLDIAARGSGKTSTAAEETNGGLSADDALSLSSRLASQLVLLRQGSARLVTGLTSFATSAATNPAGAVLRLLGLQAVLGRRGAAMQPFVPTGVEHVVITRSRVDGGWHGCTPAGGARHSSGVNGALTAKMVEDGQHLWSLPLPADKAAAAHAAAASPDEWVTISVATRHHPVRAHGAEVLLVESGPLAGQGGAKYGVWLTTTDVATGRITGSSSYTSSTPVERVARTPVVHASSYRTVHMVLHTGGQAVVAPGTQDVQQALGELGSDFIVAVPVYDAQSDSEGVAGLTLAGGAGAFKAGPAGMGEGWKVTTEQGAAHALPLAFVKLTPVWSHSLAHGGKGERLLALSVAGGDVPVLSQHVGADAASSQQEALLQAAAAEGADGAEGLESAAEAGAGPHAPVSPVTVLGDDSLLIKYSLSRTLVAAVGVGSPSRQGAVRTEFERSRDRARASARLQAKLPPASAPTPGQLGSPANLTVHLLSVPSGRILHSRRTEGGAGPVGLAVVDNWVGYTYWNAERARPEIAVLATYEGALDKFALTPWSTAAAAAAVRQAPSRVSAHTAALPVVVHRSFLLPVSLKPGALAVTRSHHGISSPFLLLGTASDGVATLDRKLVEPRRPNPEAVKDSDKAEGLIPYAPALPFRHQWLLTHGDKVARLHTISAAPSGLESTSLVLGLGVDTLVARAAPARAWDALDRDFNASLFVAVLGLMGLGTVMLGRMVKARALEDAWK